MQISAIKSKLVIVSVTMILLFGLSLHDFRLFHTSIEVFCAVVAGCVFILTMALVDTSLPAFFVIVGCGQGFVAFFTLLHMATYKGMEIIPGGSASLPSQLWIATRLLDTGALSIGVLMIGRNIGLRRVLWAFAVAAGVLLASIFVWPVFPDTFIEGVGLTPFKIATEYSLMGILAWSVWRLHSKRAFFSGAVLRRLEGAYLFNLAAGMIFTLYTDVYDFPSVLGHLTIFLSFLLLTDSLVLHMIREPQAIWFRDLFASEAKFRSLTESIPDYITRLDREYRQIYVNPAGLRMAGRTEGEMVGRTFREIGFPGDHCVFLEEKIRQVFDSTKPFHTEIEWNSPEGAVVLDLQLVPEFDANAQVTSVLCVARDITRRKQSEKSLRRNSEIQTVLREITETAVVSSSMNELYAKVYILIRQILPAKFFHINFLDEATGEIVAPFRSDGVYFIPERRPIGKGLTEYILRLGRTALLTHNDLERLFESGEVTLKNLVNAQMKQYLGAPLINSQGKSFGVMTMVLMEETQTFLPDDVKVLSIIAAQVSMAIERKQAEEGLVALCQKLEEASHAKSSFLANMSHELRTPLNAIIGFSEVLKDKIFGPLNTKQAVYVNNVMVSGQHLLSLVNDLLDLSKAEAGKMELERRPIEIKKVCQSSIDLLRDKARKRKVRLSLASDETADDVILFADDRKIKQILYNLIDNGIKYNKPGGSLTVTVEKIVMGAEPSTIRIVVEDTGIGITSEDLSLLFKPFSQLHINHTAPTEGTGLGLALTKHLVELHGGEIYVESERGKGSRFIILIPMQENEAKAVAN